MNKKIFFIVAICCIAFVGSTVSAYTDKRQNVIESKGIINYANGKVIFDTSDLIMLAEEMDDLEINYKTAITDGLAQIGTYIQENGSIDYAHESENIDIQQIEYRDLTTGILQSQSVEYLATMQASDEKGLIYYAREPNNILEVTNDDTGMPVFVTAVMEDNLASGTAGWVDGQCLTGTGADIYYFYQKGYIEGYAAKNKGTVEYTYDENGRIESAKIVLP